MHDYIHSIFLSDLNATIRRLDLLCNILAPIAVGQFMSFASMQISTIVIAAWNVVSCVVEFSLLLRVYHQVPILAKKKRANTSENEDTSKGREAALRCYLICKYRGKKI